MSFLVRAGSLYPIWVVAFGWLGVWIFTMVIILPQRTTYYQPLGPKYNILPTLLHEMGWERRGQNK